MSTSAGNIAMTPSSRRGFVGFAMVAVIMIVAAMVATTYISRQENKAVWESKEQAKTGLTTVKEALAAYQREHHKLPCPANPSLPSTDPNYGRPVSATCATGTPAGTRTFSGTTNVNEKMLVGALPTRELGLPDGAGLDKWGNKLTYAVTQKLTDPITFSVDPTDADSGRGVAKITGKTTVNSGAYVVISHGPDGKGAFSAKAALQAKPCASVAGADQENCDNDATFFDADGNSVPGAAFYDDQLLAMQADATAHP